MRWFGCRMLDLEHGLSPFPEKVTDDDAVRVRWRRDAKPQACG
jgi:hypothetical protein